MGLLLCGRFGLYTTVRSGEVLDSGRSILVASIPSHTRSPSTGRSRYAGKHFTQAGLVNPTIFEGFVQAPPAPLKPRRERQLGKRVGLRLSQQCIHRIEQGVCRSWKTPVYLVTKTLQSGKVHLSNAPFSKVSEHYSFGHSFVKRTALLSNLV